MLPYIGLDPYNLYYTCYLPSNVLQNGANPHTYYYKSILKYLGLAKRNLKVQRFFQLCLYTTNQTYG